MKKLKMAVVIFLLIMFTSGCGTFDDYLNDDSSNKGSASAANSNPVYTVSSADILKEYDSNGVSAATKYKNKVIKITGTIGTIDVDWFGDAYITLTDGSDFSLTDVRCQVTDSDEVDKLGSLSKGGTVTVVGTVGDYDMDLNLKNCSIK